MHILQLLTGEHASSPVGMEAKMQKELASYDESICLFQLLYDDARSRKDLSEMAYYRQEIRSERRARRALLAKAGKKEVHVCM